MALTRAGAKDAIETAIKLRDADRPHLDTLREYRRGKQTHPLLQVGGLPPEVRHFVDLSRVNLIKLVVEVLAQSLYVDGYRTDLEDTEADDPSWQTWQANRLDSKQAAIHRGAFTYGVSYAVVLPGDPVPVIHPKSPRQLTVVYGDDLDDPLYALETISNGDHERLVLLDDEKRWTYTTENELSYVTDEDHDMRVVPVVRFANLEDIDDEVESEVEDLIPLQDQIDVTTFELMVAQHYQAFIQRYIIGWTSDSESEKMKASASRLLTFDDENVKVGQFNQADLGPYLESRESTLQHLAIISQTPPHHLLGKLVNLSAEALAAAEAGHRRKINARQKTLGESWERVFALVARIERRPVDIGAQVRWQDTEARSLAQTVDALGKLATMLNVPPDVLWERVPGVTQRDVSEWRRRSAEADPLGNLAGILKRQASELGL